MDALRMQPKDVRAGGKRDASARPDDLLLSPRAIGVRAVRPRQRLVHR
jgi:hypothetical protein